MQTSRENGGAVDPTGGGGGSLPSSSSAAAVSKTPIKPPPPSTSTSHKCDRILSSLQDCVKKHPTQQDTVCAHLHRAAGWCLIRNICPVQGTKSSFKL
jgi:hypothetical protein